MFEGSDYPKSLNEETFDDWLEKGRLSKIRYNFLLIIWDELDVKYQAVYIEHREAINHYEQFGASTGRESLIAVYDLYSEARINLTH